MRAEAADELDTRYLFEINARWTIDGSSRRNRARYINHSCRPNAEAYFVKHVIKIRAIKNIKPGDEITYHYGRDYFDSFIKAMGCKCRACARNRAELGPRGRGRRTRRARWGARVRKPSWRRGSRVGPRLVQDDAFERIAWVVPWRALQRTPGVGIARLPAQANPRRAEID